MDTVAHELCHSQQPGISAPRGYELGDCAGWRADPLEVEARCVQAAVAADMSAADCSAMLSALDAAGIPRTPEWVAWAARRDLSAPKPSRVGRKARLAINQWARNAR